MSQLLTRISPNESKPVSLVNLTLPQLAEAYNGLDRLEKEYENMSGICATLKGLVLIEAKLKPELKGRFKQWVIDSFPKSYKTATRYMRLAEAFGKSDSTGTFQTLTRDLASSVAALRQFQLDLSHPVVAKVADWVNGRGSYQLMLDFPGGRGGDTSGSRKKLTAAQERKAFLESCKKDFEETIMALDRLHEKGFWKAESILDGHREDAAELARSFAKDITAFLKVPARKRAELEVAE